VPSKQRCSLAAEQKKHSPTWAPLVVAHGHFKQGRGVVCRSAKHVATLGLHGRARRAGATLLGGDERRRELAGTAQVVIDDVASAGTTLLADDECRREPRGRGADDRGSRGVRDRAGTTLLGGDERRCVSAGTTLMVIDDVNGAGRASLAAVECPPDRARARRCGDLVGRSRGVRTKHGNGAGTGAPMARSGTEHGARRFAGLHV